MATSDGPPNVSNVTLALARGAPSTGAPLVRFDFANGDTMSAPSINQTGFAFGSTTRAVEAAPNGQFGMKFVFNPDLVGDAWTEQSYEMGAKLIETYERIVLWVPSNFEHRRLMKIEVAAGTTLPNWVKGDMVSNSTGYQGLYHGIVQSTDGLGNAQTHIYLKYPQEPWQPSWDSGTITNTTRSLTVESLGSKLLAANNKLSFQWAGAYNSPATEKHGAMGVEYDVTDATNLVPVNSTLVSYATSSYQGNPTYGSGGTTAGTNLFVDRSTDLGQLHDFVIRRRRSSGELASDGICEIWKNGVLMRQRLTEDLWSPTDNYFERGYILGYSNSGFDEETIFYVTKYELYDSTRPEGIPA